MINLYWRKINDKMHSYHTDLDKPSKFSYPGSLRETSSKMKSTDIVSLLSPIARRSNSGMSGNGSIGVIMLERN